MAGSARVTRRPAGRRSALAVLVASAGVLAAIAFASASHRGAAGTATFAMRAESNADQGIGRLVRVEADGVETVSQWRIVGSPDVSFDGQQVLFAGGESNDPVARIREMSVDGGRVSVLFACERGCASPRYLPDGRVLFAAPAGDGAVEALFVAARGRAPERITFGRARDRAVRVLEDGRIAFLRTRLDEHGAPMGTALPLVINPDGTGVTHAFIDIPGPRAVHGVSVGGEVSGPRRTPPVATSVVDRTRHTGWLLCLDAWLTRQDDGQAVRRTATSSRMQVTDADSGAVLGEAPLAADGSFYVEVPADRLLRLSALDASGSVVSALDSGVWVRPNEHRGCIGCHEPAALAPRNAQPLALKGESAAALGPQGHGSAATGATHD